MLNEFFHFLSEVLDINELSLRLSEDVKRQRFRRFEF